MSTFELDQFLAFVDRPMLLRKAEKTVKVWSKAKYTVHKGLVAWIMIQGAVYVHKNYKSTGWPKNAYRDKSWLKSEVKEASSIWILE